MAPATVAPATEAPSSAAPPAALANIWYVNPLPNTPDWGRSSKLFTDGAAAGGYKATAVGPDKIDIPTMVSEIEQAITDKADGIITCPLDVAAFKDVIAKARAAGIIVASIGCVDPDANFSIGTDNAAFGQVAADFIANATGGKGQVGILGTDQTTPNQVAQVDAFKAQLAAKYPDMKVLTWEGDNSDAGVAAQKIPAMIAAYPTMNYIWINEGAAPGAVPAAFKEANLAPGKIGVLAIDAQDSTIQAITDGWISATLNQCWFNASPQAAKRIIEAKAGKTQPAFVPIQVDQVTKDKLPYQGCPASYTDY
ncbi:MAG: sugar ABC transporter substrate-binding protein [Candidatus Limnocylindrales bacterium]